MNRFTAGEQAWQGFHNSFIPSPINRVWKVDDMDLLQLLEQADRELGRLDMFSEYIPDISLFIRMHVLKEATFSSKIEGTQTNMKEALLQSEDVTQERRDDWEEVHNYVDAMTAAMKLLPSLPFSSRLIRKTHAVLLRGVRGRNKLPGEFRTSQNWIGGASIDDATFVPPPHAMLPELMGDIEKFANDDGHYFPELLKIALIHYQFETVHPFLDGNGRVGRLMIPIALVAKGILKQPVLYLSDFFERNRALYYDNLTGVRTRNDLTQWFKFFLVGVRDTARSGVATLDRIRKLQKDVDAKLLTLGSKAGSARKIVEQLYQNPLLIPEAAGAIAGISPASAYRLIGDLEQLGILREMTGGKRGRKFLFADYLGLFE